MSKGGKGVKRKINSRAKGKRGELMARDLLRRYGFEAERGQQRAGGGDSPDIKHNIPGWHFEVKNVERLQIRKAMQQAENDCAGKIPCVLHKENGDSWWCTFPAEELMKLLGGADFSDL